MTGERDEGGGERARDLRLTWQSQGVGRHQMPAASARGSWPEEIGGEDRAGTEELLPPLFEFETKRNLDCCFTA